MLGFKRFHRGYWVALSLFFAVSYFSVAPGHTQEDLYVSLDVAEFFDVDHQSYLEIYYAIPEKPVTYAPTADGQYASLLVMDLRLYKEDSLWTTRIWKHEKTVDDTTELDRGTAFVDMLRYYVDEPTDYRVVLYVRDMNREGRIDSVQAQVECEKFSPEEVEISDVQLASKIKRANKGVSKTFSKNNYEVIPNPTLVYGEALPTMYYYFEAYNLQDNIDNSKYNKMAFLKNADGQIVQDLRGDQTKKKRYDNSVEMGQINLSKLPTGPYSFTYGISDTDGKILAEKKKKFFVYNPSVPVKPAKRVGSGSEFRSGTLGGLKEMTGEDLDQEFDYMRYLAKIEDKEFYKQLKNPDAKREMIHSIWKSKTKEKGVGYRQLYLSRVQEANERFGSMGKEGWETDQGRVFVLYGEPTEIDRFPSTNTLKPHRIWTYNHLEGQSAVIFVFVDNFGFNKYELVHSTLRGELQDPFWEQQLPRMGRPQRGRRN
ncbi:GWxTD domain-containing protein [candidate division KSB1 bacterium]|nr:GWxTD domain-containing protein [candidate division KSB1 bacterium]